MLVEVLTDAEDTGAEGEGECEDAVFEDGKQPAGSQIGRCNSDADLTLTLCGKLE